MKIKDFQNELKDYGFEEQNELIRNRYIYSFVPDKTFVNTKYESMDGFKPYFIVTGLHIIMYLVTGKRKRLKAVYNEPKTKDFNGLSDLLDDFLKRQAASRAQQCNAGLINNTTI